MLFSDSSLTFALGAPAGALSLLYVLYRTVALFRGHDLLALPVFLQWWLAFLGFLSALRRRSGAGRG